ncbi:MAG: hypothetical protein ACI8PZ_000135 [Myxococcota bacterium]|jgi:hypothetical protein
MLRSLILVGLLAAPMTALAGFEASSELRDGRRGAGFWGPGAALDSKLESAWMVDPESGNAGSWIYLDVPTSEVDKLAIYPGWGKSQDDFSDYARVKSVTIEVFDMSDGNPVSKLVHKAELKDGMGYQIVDIPDTKVGGELLGGRVKVTINEVYPGKDYPNLAVSEVRLHLKEFVAESLTLSTPPEDVEDGKDVWDLTDGSDRKVWAAPVGVTSTSFALTAPGYGLSSVGFKAAPGYARPKTLKITANDIEVEHTLEDKADLQWVLLPTMVGYTGSAWGEIKVQIVDAYESTKGVGLAEVKLMAATIDDL